MTNFHAVAVFPDSEGATPDRAEVHRQAAPHQRHEIRPQDLRLGKELVSL